MIINKITTIILIVVVFMGLKQGLAMVNGNELMLEMFGKWNFARSGVRILGILTLAAAMMILFPQTYLAGNFLMATTILLIICLHLSVGSLKDAALELPFILMNLLLIYLQYLNKK